ncbi:MAG: DNA replication/repair protein RecF [Bacilli bacterium]
MILTKLNLINFRNYHKLNIKLNPYINIFIGKNAQGKTNILESIYILAITKSHRLALEDNYIKMGEDQAQVVGTVKAGKIIKDLKIVFNKTGKKVFLNNNEIRKISNYITNLNVIIFSPDDLDIIKGSPQIRRSLLNIEISQISQLYIQYYNEYNKILKNRNEYLKILYVNHLGDESYLDILDEKLVSRAISIYQFRSKFLTRINTKIANIFKTITGISNLYIKYDSNIDLVDFSEEEIKTKFYKKLRENRKREIIQGTTLFGPHRDDFLFFLDENNLKYYGSQGQQRLAVISFKLAEIDIFKEDTKTNPILLLDDILSEIDFEKKNKLLKYIENDVQTIITTTDLGNIQKKTLSQAKIFIVDNGTVIEKVVN